MLEKLSDKLFSLRNFASSNLPNYSSQVQRGDASFRPRSAKQTGRREKQLLELLLLLIVVDAICSRMRAHALLDHLSLTADCARVCLRNVALR